MLPWQEWVEKHFVLTDGAGDAVALESQSRSQLVTDAQAGGAPDG